MTRKVVTILVIVLLVAFSAVSAAIFSEYLPAALQIQPPGSWEVTGQTVSGTVGETVSLGFSITYVTDRCADTNIYIKTTGEARKKVSFVGTAIPGNGVTVEAERVEWSGIEVDAGVPQKHTVHTRIDRGTVGDEIRDFYVYAYCNSSGKTVLHGTAENIAIKVVAKEPTNPASALPSPSPAAAKQPVAAAPSKAPAPPPPVIQQPSPSPSPVNSIDPDGDGLSNDQEIIYGTDPNNFDTDGDGRPDGLEVREGSSPTLPHNPEDFDNDGIPDSEEIVRGTDPRNADTDHDGVSDAEEIRNGTNPLGLDFDRSVLEETSPPVRQSFFVRLASGFGTGLRNISSWLVSLFK